MSNTHPKTIGQTIIDKVRIRFPILVPLFVAILVLLISFTLAVYKLQQYHITNDVRMRLNITQQSFNQLLAADAQLLDASTRLLENNPNVQNAWLERDRDKLLGITAPLLEKFHQDYRVTHLYFIDTDRTCFLRIHNPPRFGDRIDRFTLDSSAKTGKPAWGIELGPYGTFTLRMVHPWLVNGALIGFIELGEEIEHITPQIKNMLDVDLVFLIDKSFLKREMWEEGLKMMGRNGNWDYLPDCVITNSTIPVLLPAFIKFAGLPHDRHKDHILSAELNGSTYRAGFVQLHDAAGREVGDILVIKNVSADQASLRALLAVVAVLCSCVGVLLFVFFYARIASIEKRLSEARRCLETEIEKRKQTEAELRKHRDHLEDLVKTRTAELENINKHLGEEIAERRKAKDALQNSEQRFKQVAECAGDWIWEINAEGLYTYSSPVAEQVLGYKPEEIVGKKYFYDFFAPEIKENFKRDAFAVFNKKESFVGFINPVIHKNGSTVILETTGTPILDDKGNLCGYRGADRDITERNRAQQRQSHLLEELESTVIQLNQSNKELKEFAHLAAHDLKTPLRGIGTLAQWLFDDYYNKFDDHGRQQIALLVRRVGRMNELMDAILQYSTITRNKNNEHPVDLNILFRTALAEIKPPPNIKITTNKDLPIVIYEERHIYQVFYQLLANAVRFMDKTDGRVTIDYADEDKFWRFSISDNGPGIEQQHFERIFRLFQTLSNRDETENTGVGLSLVKKIVELYGGRIWLVSQPGQGTTFFFTLPKQQASINLQILQPVAT